MKFDDFQAFLEENLPGYDVDIDSETGLITIDTAHKIASEGEELFIVPINTDVPDNVIFLHEHPKFQSAHQGGLIPAYSLPPDLVE